MTEFVAISPWSCFALIFSGFFFGHAEPGPILIGVLLLLAVREDAGSRFESGSYRRRWFIWKRVGNQAHSDTGNVVPFKEPA
jgi:hypothetical protein